jgi:hypothetical protein
MGTRNLTCVYKNGEYKVAQYGQWDGYPEGQGITILEFLKKVKMDEFSKAIDECRWITQEELDKIDKDINNGILINWQKYYPELSRDTGGEILELITFKNKRILNNSINFANDSLFCEWAYVVDLDKNTFEVYKGFNKERLSETERFYNAENNEKEYNSVILVKRFDLNNLPTKEEFIAEFTEDDEE